MVSVMIQISSVTLLDELVTGSEINLLCNNDLQNKV